RSSDLPYFDPPFTTRHRLTRRQLETVSIEEQWPGSEPAPEVAAADFQNLRSSLPRKDRVPGKKSFAICTQTVDTESRLPTKRVPCSRGKICMQGDWSEAIASRGQSCRACSFDWSHLGDSEG